MGEAGLSEVDSPVVRECEGDKGGDSDVAWLATGGLVGLNVRMNVSCRVVWPGSSADCESSWVVEPEG